MKRTSQTLHIEARLKTGESLSSIARELGVSRQRVQFIKNRQLNEVQLAVQPVMQPLVPVTLECKQTKSCTLESMSSSTLTIEIAPRTKEALNLAVLQCNRTIIKDADSNKEEPELITPNEYVEQLLMSHLAELGLLKRKTKR